MTLAIEGKNVFDSELRRLADSGSAEHQWKLSMAYRDAKRVARASRYFRKALDQGYPDAIRYQLEQWTATPGEYGNFAAAQSLLEKFPHLECLNNWRWRLGIVAGSMTLDQEIEATRQQRQQNNCEALRYIALRCSLAGYDEQARYFLWQACGAGDIWSKLILENDAIEGLPSLPGVDRNQCCEDNWERAFEQRPAAGKIELATDPLVYQSPDWLSILGCRLLAIAAENELRPSLTYDPRTGRQVESSFRTSYSMTFMPWLMDPSIAYIQRRLAAYCGLKPHQCEVLGLLRYQPGQAYQLHYDAFGEDQETVELMLQDGGQRIRTALIYLNDSFTGGETRMENLNLDVQAQTGALLVFDNVDQRGLRHTDSLHMGKAVECGSKWLLSQWYREKGTAFTRQINWEDVIADSLS